MKNLEKKLKGAFLHSFRNTQQILEIELSNDAYEEIIFFIDCTLSFSSKEIDTIVDTLKKMDPDVASIVYFIPANNKSISKVIYKSQTLELIFDNGYVIYFHLEDNIYGEPLSISFRQNMNDNNIESVDITPS